MMLVGFYLVSVVVMPAVKNITFAEKCSLKRNEKFNKRDFQRIMDT